MKNKKIAIAYILVSLLIVFVNKIFGLSSFSALTFLLLILFFRKINYSTYDYARIGLFLIAVAAFLSMFTLSWFQQVFALLGILFLIVSIVVRFYDVFIKKRNNFEIK